MLTRKLNCWRRRPLKIYLRQKSSNFICCLFFHTSVDVVHLASCFLNIMVPRPGIEQGTFTLFRLEGLPRRKSKGVKGLPESNSSPTNVKDLEFTHDSTSSNVVSSSTLVRDRLPSVLFKADFTDFIKTSPPPPSWGTGSYELKPI